MRDAILAALRKHGGLYPEQVAHILGVDRGVALLALTELSNEFKIYPEQLGMMSEHKKYFLVEVSR